MATENIDFDDGEGLFIEGTAFTGFKFWHYSLFGLIVALVFRKQLGRILKGLT